MYRLNTSTKARTPQLPKTFKNSIPRVSTSTGVIHNTSVSKSQLRSTQMKDKVVQNNSQVMIKKKKVEAHHRISSISNKTKSVTACDDSLNVKTLNAKVGCVTCDKCVFNSNHDACVSKYINDVNARTKKPNVVPINCTNHPIHRRMWMQKAHDGKPQVVKENHLQDKTTPSSKGRLHLLHMDLCGPMRVESINGKKYIQVIVDDYSRYTWTHLLRSSNETPKVQIDFLKMIQRSLQAPVINVQTDKVRDGENLDKMKEKGDSCIFVEYATQSKGYRVYNKMTRIIVDSIHINFDELKEVMTSDDNTSGLVP
ncbi:retrovirus-related pol polyprotein from transposon TNT 1-94 [Tanacetum coccineum]|uniref:Retrovirus-related pol polyprotein from transposon TNT 1-94 n=1 Tax=Tanacetum coccineum TaxID=301880 RepID=A0ABQ5DYE2_9ASTR